jgi:Ca2+-binding RTX toxin-like protein
VYSFSVIGTFSDAPLAVVSGITDLELRSQNGIISLYAAGRPGGGLLSLNVTTGISLNDYVTIPTNGTLSAPSRLGVIPINGQPSIILTGPGGTLIGGYRIEADGSLGAATVITSSPTTVVTAQANLDIGGNQFFYTAQQGSNAITVGQVSATGAMTTLQTISLGSVVAGRDVSALTPVMVGAERMLVASLFTRNEIDVFRIEADGRLTLLTTFGIVDGLWTNEPAAMAVTTLGGLTYLVLASTGSSSLTVMRLDTNGAITVVDHVMDTLDTRFEGAQAVATVSVAGRAFVLAGGADDGVNLFALMPDGRLVLMATVLDAPGLGMTSVTALTAQAGGDGIDVFVAGEGAGITRLRVELGAMALPQTGTAVANVLTGGASADQLFGGAGADSLNGSAGRDVLSDGEGEDTLTGGADADVFVLAPDGATDWITDFQLGVDRIDLSEWGRVYDLSGLTWLARAGGFAVAYGDEVLEVQTANGAALTAANFTAADFFGLWHLTGIVPIGFAPPAVNAGNDLFTATAAPEFFDGGEGRDRVDYANATVAVVVDMMTPGAGSSFAAGDSFAGIEELHGSALSDLLRGTAQGEVLQGMNGNDTLEGRGGQDSLFGGAGRDVLRPGLGSSTVDGGSSVDTVDYTLVAGAVQVNLTTLAVGGAAAGHVLVGIEHMIGSAFDDTIVGSNAAGQYFGGAGNDVMAGNGGNDLISGDGGDDTLQSGLFGEIMVGGAGYDIVDFGLSDQAVLLDLRDTRASSGFAGWDQYQQIEGYRGTRFGDTLIGAGQREDLYGGDGGDVLWGAGGGDRVFGDEGSDRIYVAANNDSLFGGSGLDWVDFSGFTTFAAQVNMQAGTAQIGTTTGYTFSGMEAVLGTTLGDTLSGSIVAEHLAGNHGDDFVLGGGGADTLAGGDGNDALFILTGAANINGGTGFDALYLSLMTTGVRLDLGQSLIVFSTNQTGSVTGIESVMGSTLNDTLTGSAFAEYLYGNTGNDLLTGNGGHDTLYGDDGDDTLQSGLFAEFLVGGTGYDVVEFALSDQAVMLDLRDTRASSGFAGWDRYSQIEGYRGSAFGDTLIGSGLSEDLFGGQGNDVLWGAGGGDRIHGDDGSDRLYVAINTDSLFGGSGFDWVDFSGFTTVGATVNMLAGTAQLGAVGGYTFAGMEAVLGTALGDTLTGGGLPEHLAGHYGDDHILGGGGADTLSGGDGSDALFVQDGMASAMGGAGFDALYLSRMSTGVRLDLGQSLIVFNTNQVASVTGIESVMGSAWTDVLTGSAAAEYLYGSGGGDMLFGNGGNDTLYGDDGDDQLFAGSGIELIVGGAGTDAVYFTRATAGVGLDLLNTAAGANVAFADVYQSIEVFYGSGFDDTLRGGVGADIFAGGGGNDILQARGGGGDVLYGEDGNDTLAPSAAGDVLFGGSGTDIADFGALAAAVTLNAGSQSVTLTTGGSILLLDCEGLTGTAFGDTLIGNDRADIFSGNDGNDFIYGDGGADRVLGGNGDDTLFGGAGGDVVDGGAGYDLAYFDGGAVVVDLSTPGNNRGDAAGDTFVFIEGLSGSGASDGLYGDAAANLFFGHAGNDVLYGRAGDDVLRGGADTDFLNGGTGIDQLYGGAGADEFSLNRGDGRDVIYDFALAEGDVLQLQRTLVGTAQNGANVLQQFGSVQAGNAVLNFGADSFTLVGLSSLSGLAAAIQII